eukprot:NODE_1229_length_1030_cov_84.103976_g853_i0.p1 GENE.NODE_1229_length_1030_cov_84.103976_g853_i0~~NODE_1229_length_1030_cov_84.103976_g853_i0.p1  ORF type:complete len:236 (-),score=61.82 NODE_1229_length_1030_cov_84.103976_g853_i0:233-940(-)
MSAYADTAKNSPTSKGGPSISALSLRLQRFTSKVSQYVKAVDDLGAPTSGHTSTANPRKHAKVYQKLLATFEKESKVADDYSKIASQYPKVVLRALPGPSVAGLSAPAKGPPAQDQELTVFSEAKLKPVYDDSQLATEEAIQREKNRELAAMAGDLMEINQIYNEFGELVENQQEHIDRIQTNVQDTTASVVAGTEELKGATVYQKKGRKVMCGIVIALLVLVGIIIAVYFGTSS